MAIYGQALCAVGRNLGPVVGAPLFAYSENICRLVVPGVHLQGLIQCNTIWTSKGEGHATIVLYCQLIL